MPGQPAVEPVLQRWVGDSHLGGAKTEGQIQADMMTPMNRASVQASIKHARNAQGRPPRICSICTHLMICPRRHTAVSRRKDVNCLTAAE
jgi:hypothetical protein